MSLAMEARKKNYAFNKKKKKHYNKKRLQKFKIKWPKLA